MHKKAKARIAAKGNKPDARPQLIKHLPKTGNCYTNFIAGIDRGCDELLGKKTISVQEAKKLQWLKSRIKIEM